MPKIAFLFVVCAAACAGGLSHAQDSSSSSLGDVARQARQQKQQKEAQAAQEAPAAPVDGSHAEDTTGTAQASKAPKKVITNDEIPEHPEPIITTQRVPNLTYPQQSSNQITADRIKSQILQMKNQIASMQSQIANLEGSVRYSGASCYACAQYNLRQQQKQQQAEALKQQLAAQQKNLEHMQEMARRQGYGSAVYDP